MENENFVYLVSGQDFTEIYDDAIKLAKKRGKKIGDNIGQEFMEIAKKKNKKIKCLGQTLMDSDLLTGNLREQGIKVLNLNEEKRKNA